MALFGGVDKARERAQDLDGDGNPDSSTEQLIWVGLFVFLFALTFWLSFWFSAFIAGFDVLPTVALKSLPQGIAGVLAHPGDPSHGWGEYKPIISSAWIFWPVFLLVVSGEFRLVKKGLRFWRRLKYSGKNDAAHWAEDGELEEIIDPREHRLLQKIGYRPKQAQGVILGVTEDTKRILRLQPENHAVIVAGTRSGKTAGLCTPAILSFEGAVLAASVKDDLVKSTIAHRQTEGKVFIFDPSRFMDLDDDEISYWSPLMAANDWRGAIRMSEALIDVALNKGDGGNMQFFKAMSQQVLPVLLYSAAVMNEDMRRVLRWLHRISDERTHKQITEILKWKKNAKALDVWQGFIARDPKMRGDIAATIQSALVSYEDPKVQESAITKGKSIERIITPEKFLDGGNNTLYIVAAPDEQERLEPVFVALIQSMLTWVLGQPKPLDVPLLAVLDEAANIAALPMLPTFLSTIGSKQVSIITAWQDFAQIADRYKNQKNTVLNNSRGKIILPGVSDPETMAYFRDITGEGVQESISVSRQENDNDGRSRQISVGEQRRTLLDPVVLRGQEFGHGILVYGNLPPVRMKVRLFFKEPDLRAKAGLPVIPTWQTTLQNIPIIGRFIKS